MNSCRNGHPRTEANTYVYKGREFCRPCRAKAEARRRENVGPIYRSRKAWYRKNKVRLNENARAAYAANRERRSALARIRLIARKLDPSAGEIAHLLELRARLNEK